MATDFPTSPTNGQLFTSSNGNVYYWDSSKTAWRARPQSLAPATVGEAPPSNPVSGSLWYNSADGNLYVYYSDSNSSQWVQIRTDMSFTSTIGPAVDSLKLRSPNYIINGAFDIWQRGTSFTSGIGYTADRWTNTTAPSATITRTAVAHAGVVPEHIQYQVDISGGSVSTAGYSYYEQPIEDVRTLAGQTATLSFYAKGSVAGTIGTTFIQNFGTGGSANLFTLGANFNITTTWQRYSVTVSIPSVSGKTIGANSYLDFRFVRGLGTNYAPTSSGIPALVDYTGTLSITGVQLEAGAQTTIFRRNSPSIQAELAACQRYFIAFPIGSYFISNPYFAVALSGGPQLSMTSLPTAMRTIPGVTNNSGSTNIAFAYYNTSAGGEASRVVTAQTAVSTTNLVWTYINTNNSGSATLPANYATGSNAQIIWVSAEF